MLSLIGFIFTGILGVIATAIILAVTLLIAIIPWVTKEYITEKRAKYGPYQLNVMDTQIKEVVFFGIIGGIILYPALPVILAILMVPLGLIVLAILMLIPGIICDFEKNQDVYKFKIITGNAFEIGFLAVVIGLLIAVT
jgi:ABC-type Fe3+ transport system permease subunit